MAMIITEALGIASSHPDLLWLRHQAACVQMQMRVAQKQAACLVDLQRMMHRGSADRDDAGLSFVGGVGEARGTTSRTGAICCAMFVTSRPAVGVHGSGHATADIDSKDTREARENAGNMATSRKRSRPARGAVRDVSRSREVAVVGLPRR
mmetsp:Transcript_9581/g.20100  ORF Transcript_9581/g.20100 Transcript_9581/m.20100 type:complete len:151 (-) Transcript_9581:235-687(-)